MSELELEEALADTAVEETKAIDNRDTPRKDDWEPVDAPITGVRVGLLVGIKHDGRTPLVIFAGQQGSAAVAARTAIDLQGSHVGRDVVLMFEEGDPRQPIVMGCLPLRDGSNNPHGLPGKVEVNADGERLFVTARAQLVLRCGKATITLTKAGKVLIQGTYISSRSSGTNRIKGGSVQLN